MAERERMKSIGLRVAMLTLIMAWSVGAQAQSPASPHPRGPDALGGQLFAAAKARLNLDTSQQQQWDAAMAEAQSARRAMRDNRATLKQALQNELAKSEPDLSAVASAADQIQQSNRALHLQAQAEWLKLYAMLMPAQKAVVRDLLLERLARAESLRSRLKGQWGAQQGQ